MLIQKELNLSESAPKKWRNKIYTILERRFFLLVFFFANKCCLPARRLTIFPVPVTRNLLAEAWNYKKIIVNNMYPKHYCKHRCYLKYLAAKSLVDHLKQYNGSSPYSIIWYPLPTIKMIKKPTLYACINIRRYHNIISGWQITVNSFFLFFITVTLEANAFESNESR